MEELEFMLFDEDIFGGAYDKINAYIKRIMDDK